MTEQLRESEVSAEEDEPNAREASQGGLTQRLMRASGVTSWLAFILSIGTMVFMLWFRSELETQSEVGVPMARAVGQLNASVRRSVASLRGWVAYEDPAFVESRHQDWESIESAQTTIGSLVALDDEHRVTQQAQLDALLANLRRVQWAIEDVSHTIGNEPARVDFEGRLEPLFEGALAGLRDLRDLSLDPGLVTADRLALIMEVTTAIDTLRSSFDALDRFVDSGSDVEQRDHRSRALHALEVTRALVARISAEAHPDALALAQFSEREIGAYIVVAESVISRRQAPEWNVSQALFQQDALPLTARVSELAAEIADQETAALQHSVQLFAAFSWLVIGASLLLAILAGLAIFVSLRLRLRVNTVLRRVKKLGQYEIKEKLGEGGMGQVYLAQHALLRRPTAVKLLRPAISENRRARERFAREVQLTSQLTHPNTVEIFDYGRTADGVLYYAMEYIEGASLQLIVDVSGALPEARALFILRQIAASLADAHRNELLHRDIKPANVMLCERGGACDTVKVLDFGLVRHVADVYQAEEEPGIVGTPLYLAPEVILDQDGYSEQSDVYAFGVLAHFILTGRPLFTGENVLDILSQHMATMPSAPTALGVNVSAELERLIMSCLDKDPTVRPSGVKEVISHLDECRVQQPWNAKRARIWWHEFGAVITAHQMTHRSTESRSRDP